MATVPDIPSTDLHRGIGWKLRYSVSLLGESWPAMIGVFLVASPLGRNVTDADEAPAPPILRIAD